MERHHIGEFGHHPDWGVGTGRTDEVDEFEGTDTRVVVENIGGHQFEEMIG